MAGCSRKLYIFTTDLYTCIKYLCENFEFTWVKMLNFLEHTLTYFEKTASIRYRKSQQNMLHLLNYNIFTETDVHDIASALSGGTSNYYTGKIRQSYEH